MKYCKDCRWFGPRMSLGSTGPACQHPEVMRDDPVHGPMPMGPYEARGASGPCGYEGKLWEANRPLSFLQKLGLKPPPSPDRP